MVQYAPLVSLSSREWLEAKGGPERRSPEPLNTRARARAARAIQLEHGECPVYLFPDFGYMYPGIHRVQVHSEPSRHAWLHANASKRSSTSP